MHRVFHISKQAAIGINVCSAFIRPWPEMRKQWNSFVRHCIDSTWNEDRACARRDESLLFEYLALPHIRGAEKIKFVSSFFGNLSFRNELKAEKIQHIRKGIQFNSSKNCE